MVFLKKIALPASGVGSGPAAPEERWRGGSREGLGQPQALPGRFAAGPALSAPAWVLRFASAILAAKTCIALALCGATRAEGGTLVWFGKGPYPVALPDP